MTIQQAAQTAINVQDAVNLSGVLLSFNEIVQEVLWPEARRLGEGTAWVNRHPVCTLFLDKLAALNRSQCLCPASMNYFGQAYNECCKLAGISTEDE